MCLLCQSEAFAIATGSLQVITQMAALCSNLIYIQRKKQRSELGRKWELKDRMKGNLKKIEVKGGDTQEVTLLNLKREIATNVGLLL